MRALRCRSLNGVSLLVAGAMILTLSSCSSNHPSRSPYQPRTLDARDRVRAEELCDQAEPLMATDPAEAEVLLLEALTADTLSGRAHNNLGVIYLGQERLYEAATEFDLARRLLPDNPDPRINLGLTLEQAGRIDEAIDAFAAAHELNSSHLGSMQALARAQVRHGRTDALTVSLLQEIALRGDSTWREWANRQQLRLD